MPNPLCTIESVLLNLDCLSETSWGTLFCGKRCLPLPLARSPSPIGESGPPLRIRTTQNFRGRSLIGFLTAQSRAGSYTLYAIAYAISVLSHVAGNLKRIRRTILFYCNNDIPFYDISPNNFSDISLLICFSWRSESEHGHTFWHIEQIQVLINGIYSLYINFDCFPILDRTKNINF